MIGSRISDNKFRIYKLSVKERSGLASKDKLEHKPYWVSSPSPLVVHLGNGPPAQIDVECVDLILWRLTLFLLVLKSRLIRKEFRSM